MNMQALVVGIFHFFYRSAHRRRGTHKTVFNSRFASFLLQIEEQSIMKNHIQHTLYECYLNYINIFLPPRATVADIIVLYAIMKTYTRKI